MSPSLQEALSSPVLGSPVAEYMLEAEEEAKRAAEDREACERRRKELEPFMPRPAPERGILWGLQPR